MIEGTFYQNHGFKEIQRTCLCCIQITNIIRFWKNLGDNWMKNES